MGTVIHRATIVTSSDRDMIKAARREAGRLFPKGIVTSVKMSPVNCYGTFAILTCGSKQGWGEADMDAAARRIFLTWVRGQAYSDGSNHLEVVDVVYGADCGAPSVVSP